MLVMGILNVTPDSFADGGLHFDESLAIAHGLEMIEDGVDIIDVGGESTRPGAERVSAEEEQKRVIPVIRELAKHRAVISIDTMRAKTAKLAVEAGATIVNDVSGGAADPEMFSTVAGLGCKYTLMHWRGHSKDMNSKAIYDDVVLDVIREVSLQLDKALAAGIRRENIILDPGIGFAKDAEHNWELLNRIDELIRFRPLQPEDLEPIVLLQLRELQALLQEQGLELQVREEVVAWLARESYDPEYGARPLRRLLRRQLENPLATAMLEEKFSAARAVLVEMEADLPCFRPVM
ncbi:MAG: dihydropteroate synthase [Synechococcaceae bacterium WB5_2A_257]|nr:dihydropteroate synthase [Synechococcaceae bacterium WB5_2A_257]